MSSRPSTHLDEPFVGAWDERPWPLAIELAQTLPRGSWSLVGGLMVQAHAHLRSLPPGRETTDVDGVVHLETGTVSYGDVARAMSEAGFELLGGTAHAYRFTRGEHDVVDLMVSDRLVAQRSPRHAGRPLFGVPGATRALMETGDVTFRGDGRELATLSLPSVKGALVLKGAAYLDDSRDRRRHLRDGVVLLACVDDPTGVREGLSATSRKRVRALLRGVASDREAWSRLHPDVVSRAEPVLAEMSRVFDVDGRDNSAGPAAPKDAAAQRRDDAIMAARRRAHPELFANDAVDRRSPDASVPELG